MSGNSGTGGDAWLGSPFAYTQRAEPVPAAADAEPPAEDDPQDDAAEKP